MFRLTASGVTTLELPNPELDDAVGLLADVNIKRTMDNGFRTYVRKKSRKIYKYNFTLTMQQATLLLTFYKAALWKQVTIEVQDEVEVTIETIVGYFAENPLEIIKTGRENCEEQGEIVGVVLTFEGNYA
jgi:hypothetical protein